MTDRVSRSPSGFIFLTVDESETDTAIQSCKKATYIYIYIAYLLSIEVCLIVKAGVKDIVMVMVEGRRSKMQPLRTRRDRIGRWMGGDGRQLLCSLNHSFAPTRLPCHVGKDRSYTRPPQL